MTACGICGGFDYRHDPVAHGVDEWAGRVNDQCTCGWDVEYALLCTASPGVLQPTENLIALCPPERGCMDAVAHRTDGGNWHTTRGTRIADWYAQRTPQQLTLDGVG